jgi:hypothetical protein
MKKKITSIGTVPKSNTKIVERGKIYLKCPKSTSCSFTREIWQYENIDLELFNNKINEKLGLINYLILLVLL